MTSLVGNFSLSFVILAALGGFVAAVGAARFQSELAMRLARSSLWAIVGLFGLASVLLLMAFIRDDFSLAYVWEYSERALPLGYKLAAFWAGQPGSLLLWGLMLAVMSLIAMLAGRQSTLIEAATVVGTLALGCGFFAAVMVFNANANPFAPNLVMAMDGHGLNPLLQDPWMISHPPMLFLGYAGFMVPFALWMGAMLAGRTDVQWLGAVRRWSMAAWLFLSIGIVLGAEWAYTSWGRYWGWDPVENASLLPWFTATALLHSIMPQQHRGMFKRWTAALIAVTFLLCIFAAFLMRGGMVGSSRHDFGKSMVSTFFLVYLVIAAAVALGVIWWRLPMLKSDRPLEALSGREGMFLLTNILLVLMMLVTTVGTMLPAITKLFGSEIQPDASFYNHWVVPMGMALMALMAIGPLLGYGTEGADRLPRKLIAPGIGALVAVVAILTVRWVSFWAAVAAAIVGAALVAIAMDLARRYMERVRGMGEGALVAAYRVFDTDHRRYGGQIVHVGMLMMLAGIVGSSVFAEKKEYVLQDGQTVKLGRYAVALSSVEETKGENYAGVEARMTLVDARGRATRLRPEVRFYQKDMEQARMEGREAQRYSIVALDSGWTEDFYVMLLGWSEHSATIQASLNPLVSWIWIGGLVLTLGAVVCLLPRLEPRAWRVRETETQAGEQPVQPAMTSPPRATLGS